MYHFIVNPHSRTDKTKLLWETIKKELELRKIVYTAHFTEYPGHATELAKTITTSYNGMKTIIMVGGDGTANEIINGIDNYSEVILGYIPTGSSNDLARGLGIKKDPVEALDHILVPKRVQTIDYGLVTYYDGTAPRKFDVSSGIGYDADICYDALHSPIKTVLNKIGLGKLTYFLIGMKQIFMNQPHDIVATLDGHEKRTFKNAVFITSMIQKFEGGGLPMAPSADYTDGKLTVCFVSGIPKIKIFFLMPTIFFGKHTHIKGIEFANCSTLELKAAAPMVIHTDGEFGGKKDHILVSCLPQKIRICV